MKHVMAYVKLSEINLNVIAVLRTRAGHILLQVNRKDEADRLSNHQQAAISWIAKMNRPSRNTSVLVVNIPVWMDNDQVGEEIRAAKPSLADIAIRVRENAGRGGVTQLNVPMATAVVLAEC